MQPVRELPVPLPAGGQVTARIYRSAAPARAALILAHGAGAGHHSPFMVAFAEALAGLGVDAVTFNFLYTEQGRKVPDRPPVLEACYLAVIDRVRREVPSAETALFIGGKSMGGRIATHVATDPALRLSGVVLLGYPLHPPGKPQQRRDAHLGDVAAPMLFVQGSRDAFGTPTELAPVLSSLAGRATLHIVEGGDHSFKVARAGRQGQETIHAGLQQVIVDWIAAQPAA